MYRSVAENPHGDFHFEMGRRSGRAARLPAQRDLDRHSGRSDQFIAGVGYYFHLAGISRKVRRWSISAAGPVWIALSPH